MGDSFQLDRRRRRFGEAWSSVAKRSSINVPPRIVNTPEKSVSIQPTLPQKICVVCVIGSGVLGESSMDETLDYSAYELLDSSQLNHVQRRCLAVLKGGRANDELRQAAIAMLKSGGLPKREAKAAAATTRKPLQRAAPKAQAPAMSSWSCTACTFENASGNVCGACSTARTAVQTPRCWFCPACTLANVEGAARCSACNEPRSKPPAASVKRPADFDEEDEEAFAVRPLPQVSAPKDSS